MLFLFIIFLTITSYKITNSNYYTYYIESASLAPKQLKLNCSTVEEEPEQEPEWDFPFTENRSFLCFSICKNNLGGILKKGNICKCVYLDENCCTTEKQCLQNYCMDNERAEGANKDECRFFPSQNKCFTYKFIKVIE